MTLLHAGMTSSESRHLCVDIYVSGMMAFDKFGNDYACLILTVYSIPSFLRMPSTRFNLSVTACSGKVKRKREGPSMRNCLEHV